MISDLKLNNHFEKKKPENNGAFNVNYGNVFKTVKCFYKIKRYYVSYLNFKTNRLMYFINIILSGFIDGFTLFCHFTYLAEKQIVCARFYAWVIVLHVFYFFFQMNIYPFLRLSFKNHTNIGLTRQ